MWKNELIATQSDAEKTLKRYLSIAERRPHHLNRHAHNDAWSFSADRFSEEEEEPVLHVCCRYQQRFEISNLLVADHLRGRGLGALATKCAIGVAYALKYPLIHLSNINLDGFSFWPTMGALPYDTPSFIAEDIGETLKTYRHTLSRREVTVLSQVLDLAVDDAFRGWRALSQSEIKLKDGKFFRTAVFEKRIRNLELVILLNDPSTQTLLKRRLGALPHFPLHRSGQTTTMSQCLQELSP